MIAKCTSTINKEFYFILFFIFLSLKSCERTKLKAEVGKINETVKRIQTHNITELNSLMYAATYATTERMGMIKGRKGRRTEEPFWRRRIKGNIETWRKDLSKIEEVRRGNMRLKQRERERLNRKYHLEDEIARMLARLYMSRECTRVDGQGKTSFDTKGNRKRVPSNYRPIACLPMMWKLLAGVMGEKLYQHLETNGLLTYEQKGAGRDPEELKINCL